MKYRRFTEKAHIAVIAIDENNYRYLCDLGDQWIQPICVDKNSPLFAFGEITFQIKSSTRMHLTGTVKDKGRSLLKMIFQIRPYSFYSIKFSAN